MVRNLLNSFSHDRTQTADRSRKNIDGALTGSDGVDRGNLDLRDTSLPASPVDTYGAALIGGGANETMSSGVNALSGSGSSGSTSLTVGAGSGIVFKDTFDSSCSQAYINCVVAAENAIRGLWTNSITFNLDFSLAANGTNADMAPNTASYGVNVTYAQLRQALAKADAASPDTYAQTAALFLPVANPAGTTDFTLPEAYARMLGLSSATPGVDGNITLNSSFKWSFGQDVINETEHQISECVMGRVGGLGDNSNGWSTMDLFRCNASPALGAFDVTDGRDGQTTFFSFNNGSTLSSLSFNNLFNALGQKVSSDDTSDFAEQDVFGSASPGESNTLSATDLDVMDVLGWIPSSPHGTPGILTTNTLVWENGAINGVALQDGMNNPSGDSITAFAFRDLGSNGHFTLNGAPVQNGQWVSVTPGNLDTLLYQAGAGLGTDSIQEIAYDATLSKWLGTSTFSVSTTIEPVASVKNFAVAEGQSLSMGPITGVTNPSGDRITGYAFLDAGTNGHFAVGADVGSGSTAEPNSQWLVVSSFALGDVQYVGGSTTGSDPIEVRAFDGSTDSWTAVSSATATTRQPILPPPGGGGPTPSPVHALALTSQTSGVAGTASFTSNAADTLVAPFPDATLVGGAASDTFVIGAGAGHESIQNFDPGHDTLQFSPSLFANYAAAMTDARQVGTGTVFTIDAHDSVTLQNVSVGTLTASNVHFS
jgi:hypothetical protein